MQQAVKEAIHKENGDDQNNNGVVWNAIAGGNRRFARVRRSREVGRHDQAVGADVAQLVVYGDQGDEHEGEASGPFQQNQQDEGAIGGRRDDGVKLRAGRGRWARREAQ